MTSPSVGPAYRERLARVAAAAAFTKPLATANPTVEIEAAVGGVSLSAAIDTREHRVVGMSGSAPMGSDEAALLAGLAQVSVGRGIQDASEHAAIRLENLLRDPAAPRAVPGIVQPENADPAFRLPLSLIRRIYADYRKRTGYKPDWNYEDDLPSGEWMSIGHEERVRRILAAIPEACPETGIRRADVRVKGIDLDTKVLLALPPGVDLKTEQKYVMRAEAEVKSRVEPRLELYLEYAHDRNTKRHHQLGPKS